MACLPFCWLYVEISYQTGEQPQVATAPGVRPVEGERLEQPAQDEGARHVDDQGDGKEAAGGRDGRREQGAHGGAGRAPGEDEQNGPPVEVHGQWGSRGQAASTLQ